LKNFTIIIKGNKSLRCWIKDDPSVIDDNVDVMLIQECKAECVAYHPLIGYFFLFFKNCKAIKKICSYLTIRLANSEISIK